MASPDIFMSSPPKSRTRDPVSISSSSPYLPSLEEIFLNKNAPIPPLRTGKHAAPVPANARTTLTSAANVLREAPEIDIETEKITSSPSRKSRPSKGRKRKSSTPDNLSTERVSNHASVAVESLSPSDRPWQKFKTKNHGSHDGNPLSPSRPKTSIVRKSSSKATCTVSRHFSTEATQPPLDIETKRSKIKTIKSSAKVLPPTNVESATPRRHDWTPPRNSATIILDSDSDTRELFSSADKKHCSKEVFQTLYDQYGRQDIGTTPEACPQFETEILRKRQRLELISTGQAKPSEVSREQSPATIDLDVPQGQNKQTGSKAPAPKRKARTVTEAAIAPFAAPVIPDLELAGPSTKESMLNYFDSDGAVKALVEHQTAVMSQRKTKGKETKQPTKSKRKMKSGSEKNPILLSPSSALKQSSHQDFVFGTSSQLVQEESPTTLRDLQAAIHASNNLDSDPFDDGDSSRRLWHAGARDEDGELMEMEIVDLQRNSTITTGLNQTPQSGGGSFVDIDDLLDSPLPKAQVSSRPSESQPDNSPSFQPQGVNQTLGAKPSEVAASVVENAPVEPCPNYELFTDAQLSKQITLYGFKPMKKRTAMIALLKQCWASKQQGVSGTSIQSLAKSTRSTSPVRQQPIDTVAVKTKEKPRGRGRPKKTDDAKVAAPQPMTSTQLSPKRSRGRQSKNESALAVAPTTTKSTSASSPKRPRGRPRKSSTPSLEIADSAEGSPSPASSPDPVFSSPPPLDLSTTDEADMSLTLSPTNQQAELFRHITKAVISAPRSKDPSDPSWYEKMLLYDPIILEDLASWLNGGALTDAGFDGEVSAFDVKKWCERKSVICL